jgi:hypothetical protein
MLKSFHIYHISAKMILPLCFTNMLCRHYTDAGAAQILCDGITISNIVYHSYTSTTFVITDYISSKKIQKQLVRASLCGHVATTAALFAAANPNLLTNLKDYIQH